MVEPVIIGRATLYNADCRDVLPLLGKVDAVVTDPPYGLAYKQFNKRQRIHNDGPLEFRRLIVQMAPMLARLQPRTLAMFTRWDVWRDVHNAFEHLFPPCTCLVWDKDDLGKGNLNHFGTSHEFVYVSAPPDHVMKVDGKRPSNVLRARRVSSAASVHPTEKPLNVMDYLVQALSMDGDVVLDPFMGGGSTGVAALQRGRRFVGIETDPRHFETACRRISETLGDAGPLFGEAA